MQLTFFSPDTDVLALVIAKYDLLPRHTSISTASSVLKIQPFWDVQGPAKAKVLLAFSGADNTRKFARVGKVM